MSDIRKTFNFRTGVQVDDETFIVRGSQVGIGTTIPTEALDVRGNAKVVGVLTATNIDISAGISTFGDVKVGTGISISASSGVVTATKFVGDGSDLEGVASAGLGTGLSDDQTNTLNKIYYSDDVLLVGSSITINPPPSTSNTYTQYMEIKVDTGADLIVNSGSFIPDVLNLANWDE